jgi:fermentation-respiration switch protein FrsA (DUF1100 family)
MSVQNILIVFGILVVLGLAGTYIAFHIFYNSIYQFHQTVKTPEEIGFDGVKVVEFVSEDGENVAAWVKAPDPGKPVVFYFMGNWSAIGPAAERLKTFTEDGYGLAALVYRRSSGMGGTPSEENFAADARALYDQYNDLAETDVPATMRFSYGYSLGSGVAARLAEDREVGGLILAAAFGRFCDYFTGRYRGLPFCYFMWKERYDSIDRIAKINAPFLLVHGEKDIAINVSSADRLFKAAIEPKRYVRYQDGTHLNLHALGLMDEMKDFMTENASSN